jgi:hypothetical protein
MTDLELLHNWCELLHEMFPTRAVFDCRQPAEQLAPAQIRICWRVSDPHRPVRMSRTFVILISPDAWKGYEQAASDLKAQADRRLVALVKAKLPEYDPGHASGIGQVVPEYLVRVEAADLFPVAN